MRGSPTLGSRAYSEGVSIQTWSPLGSMAT